MATIHQAKKGLVYTLAILVGGIFSFMGKPAPTWAKEAKKQHSAKIFNDDFVGFTHAEGNKPLYAQNSEDNTRVFTQPSDRVFTVTNDAGASGSDNRVFTSPGDRVFTSPGNRVFTSPGNRVFSSPANRVFSIDRVFTAPEQAEQVNQQLEDLMKGIQSKVQNGDALTAGEMALLIEIELSRRVDAIELINTWKDSEN